MDTTNFGGMWTWLIILLLFLFNGNGWFGWFGWGNAAAWMAGLANNNNNHDNTVDIINNNSFRQQQLANQQAIANLSSWMWMWFCNTNSNIEKAIQQGIQNTCQIMTNCTANTQKILDMMCNQETQRLRTELAEARVIAQNNQQTNELITRLSPTPTPSWIVASPYTSIYPPATTTATAGA